MALIIVVFSAHASKSQCISSRDAGCRRLQIRDGCNNDKIQILAEFEAVDDFIRRLRSGRGNTGSYDGL